MKTMLRSELTCPSCIVKIEKQLQGLLGVEEATVHFTTGRIEVEHGGERAGAVELIEAVRRAVRPASRPTKLQPLGWRLSRASGRAQYLRIVVKTYDLIRRRKQLMLTSGGLLAGGLLAGHVWDLSAAAAVLLTGAAVVAGSDIAVRAWNALRGRHISIELLVTVAPPVRSSSANT